MRARSIVCYAVAAVLLLGGSFLAGSVWQWGSSSAATPQRDPAREDLLKQLVMTKATIQTGLSLRDLGDQEKQVRANTELADRTLSVAEHRMIGDVIDAFETIRAAWAITEDYCHRAIEDASFVILRSPFLEKYKPASQCALPERNDSLREEFKKLGAAAQFDAIASAIPHAFPRSSLFVPLLTACLVRVQAAIDALSF
jgi:hypothetical protein